MARIVLIDGENLLYALRAMASKTDTRLRRELFTNFPIKELINEALGETEFAQFLFFGAKLKLYDFDEGIKKKLTASIRAQSRLANSLHRQGISFLKTGYLRARESDPCTKCGHIERYLTEKGVDVGIAVRMVAEAQKGNEIVLVSSDTDLLPAVKEARKLGVNVYFVGYDFRPILALVRAASYTRMITTPTVKRLYKTIKDKTDA